MVLCVLSISGDFLLLLFTPYKSPCLLCSFSIALALFLLLPWLLGADPTNLQCTLAPCPRTVFA
jgi:hypothetical protein